MRRRIFDAARADELGAQLAECPDGDAARVGELKSQVLSRFFDRIVSVPRLREVRVLAGFSRLKPVTADGSERSAELAPLAKTDPGWRPAVEVRGEGVFLRFDGDRLDTWEGRRAVLARANTLDRRHAELVKGNTCATPRLITARLVLIHTFAHALIEALSLDPGYPAASLRERLFVSDDMRGLLVYTATSDAAGSLGGLIAQAATDRLAGLVRQTIQRAAWCSADPVCIESRASGTDGLTSPPATPAASCPRPPARSATSCSTEL